MNNELKEMLQSVINDALAPVNERLDKIDGKLDRLEGRMDNLEGKMDKLEGRMDKLEGRFDQLETEMYTRFADVDAKLIAISEQVARNSESMNDLKEQIIPFKDLPENVQVLHQRVDDLTLDVKILKKAIC